MKILAIETSDKIADIAILDTELDKVWEKELETVQKVSEVLTSEIESLCKTVGTGPSSSAGRRDLSLQQIDLIAIGIGPGSYTGTRVGIATAKGLAQGLDIPIIGVNSFEALIEMIDEDYESLPVGEIHESPTTSQKSKTKGSFCSPEIIPLIDAKNNRVYFQIPVGNCHGCSFEQGCTDITEVLNKLADKNYVFVGTGATAHRSLIAESFQEQAKIDDRDQVSAKFIAQIAQNRTEANLHDDVIGLKPLYINKPNIGRRKN